MIALIWAQDKNGLIGKEGTLPWRVPTDLAYFKEKTLGQTLVFGHTTFVGMGGRLLKNRQTLILSRKPELSIPGATVVHSTAEILALAKKQLVMIAGGSHVYEEFLPHADVLYQTVIDKAYEGDRYFPSVDWDNFTLSTSEIFHDKTSGVSGHFNTYQKK